MSALLLNGYLTAAAATASSAATGYPATAVLTPGVSRGWRSTAGGAQWLRLDFGAPVAIAALALQAFNAGAISVTGDNSNPPVTARGSLTGGLDENNRLKCSLVAAFMARYVQFNFSGGGAYYFVGSAFAFSAATATAADPLYGGSSLTLLDPQGRNDLTNGVVELYAAGASSTEIDLGFRGSATADIEFIKRAARAAPCWFDFGLTDRGRQWPVRHIEPTTVRQLSGFNRESTSIKLREII
jgi:hypothetical protein